STRPRSGELGITVIARPDRFSSIPHTARRMAVARASSDMDRGRVRSGARHPARRCVVHWSECRRPAPDDTGADGVAHAIRTKPGIRRNSTEFGLPIAAL
ncbi:hypothetical protein, partial [Burkholderia gladioli]|uniref:hypothetical protein n=1 Tax=Burkholderia gladioli TaxID=28095 RepID=UPI001C615AB5